MLLHSHSTTFHRRSGCRDRTRLRIQCTSFSQPVSAWWVWFQRHTLICLADVPVCWRSSQVITPPHSFYTSSRQFSSSSTPVHDRVSTRGSCARWHNRSHQKRQCVSRTRLVKTNRDRRGPWTKPRTRLRTSEIKSRSWTVGNHCPSRMTPANWATRYSRQGRGLCLNFWLLVGGWFFARVWSNSWTRRRPDLLLSVASCNVTPVRTSMVMTVQFSALVQSQMCCGTRPKHWLRLAFRAVNVAVFQRVLACCLRSVALCTALVDFGAEIRTWYVQHVKLPFSSWELPTSLRVWN